MQARRDDDLKDSFYLYIMRNSIGAGLRSQYAPPNGHVSGRLAELMREIDAERLCDGKEKERREAGEKKEEERPQPARGGRER